MLGKSCLRSSSKSTMWSMIWLASSLLGSCEIKAASSGLTVEYMPIVGELGFEYLFKLSPLYRMPLMVPIVLVV